jgi:hypothetical protein
MKGHNITLCNFFWGTHGCDLAEDHGKVHECESRDPEGPCCQYDETDLNSPKVRFTYWDDEGGSPEWGEWIEWSSKGWYQTKWDGHPQRCIAGMDVSSHPNAPKFICNLPVNEDSYCEWGHYQPEYETERRTR